MFIRHKPIWMVLVAAVTGAGQLSCKKLVTVPEPVNSITTTEVFNFDAQGASAMAGVYNQMINGQLSFSNGYVTLLAGMSSDELFYYGTTSDFNITAFAPNQLLYNNSYTSTVWTTAYKTIYGANSVIEGVAASHSDMLTDSARKELTGEAKFVRAFCYFYLVNLYGDVPLALTVDFNDTRYMARTPAAKVYEQVVQDLKDAQSLLPKDYSVVTTGATDRTMPNAWAATALLARAYLYTGKYADAATQAGAVLANTSLYNLETDPNKTFLIASKEAIWQMRQGNGDYNKNGTVEAFNMLPNPLLTGPAHYCLTASLLNAFEPGDRRRAAWLDSTTNAPAGTYNYYSFKYKTGGYNAVTGAAPTEYYTMLRLAEMYLVRAEAEANGAAGGTAAAITDLNVLRSRAGLTALSSSLTASQVTAAVAHERQIELFAEWGHRWLDLKRTGQAKAVLSAMASKQPWTGDYQLLYPIPPGEILVDHFLEQNPGY